MAGGVRVTDRDRGMKRVARQLAGLKGTTITVGHHPGGSYPDGTPIALVAAVHEFGAPGKNIPPRPTLGPTVDGHEKRYAAELARLEADALAGRRTTEGAASVFGSHVVADIKRAITELHSPALAPATVAAKGSSQPLIDTGAMRDDRDFRVKMGSG